MPNTPRNEWHYEVFGLRLASNRPIREFTLVQPTKHDTDVRLFVDVESPFNHKNGVVESTTEWFTEKNKPALKIAKIRNANGVGFLQLVYGDGARFLIAKSGEAVYCQRTGEISWEGVLSYLSGVVLGYVLRLHRFACLHASVVVIDGCGVAMLGSAGTGKSTLAAMFAQKGYSVLSDDIAAIQFRGDTPFVFAGPRRVRLWASSAELLFDRTLPRIDPTHPTWDKQYLGLPTVPTNAIPLHAIYFLNIRQTDCVSPTIHPLSAKDAVLRLITNTFADRLISKEMRKLEFAQFDRLVKQVELRQVSAGTGRQALADLATAIVQDQTV